jgi:putative Mg2+ transporter-C (MgtC) family protein
VEQWELLARILLAALLGYGIGWEREFRGKPAGERTFALIALGAAAFTGIGLDRFSVTSTTRIVQGVVTGVGFLGAGLIFRPERGTVHGLTTAASAWAACAIGVLSGAGDYVIAAATAVAVILILELNYVPVIKRLDARRRQRARSQGEEEG